MQLGAPPVTLNVNPLVFYVDGFASAAECAAAQAAADGRLTRSKITYDGLHDQESDHRTNSAAAVKHRRDPALAGLAMRIGMLLRMPFTHAERMAVLHYRPGETFHDHQDGFLITPETAAELDAHGGQRLFTSILYLNDVPGGGGATVFPRLGIEVAPAQGRLLVFANCLAGGRDQCDLSLHAGAPVAEGEKWAATVWWREFPVPE